VQVHGKIWVNQIQDGRLAAIFLLENVIFRLYSEANKTLTIQVILLKFSIDVPLEKVFNVLDWFFYGVTIVQSAAIFVLVNALSYSESSFLRKIFHTK